jgi:membrane protein YdbS with pleckstrin-like domain
MSKFVVECWNIVMDHSKNPLRNIPSLPVRYMLLQVLAWMWVIAFTIASGTWAYAGLNAVVHAVLLAAIAITVAVFETAKRKPQLFNKYNYNSRGQGGEHE